MTFVCNHGNNRQTDIIISVFHEWMYFSARVCVVGVLGGGGGGGMTLGCEEAGRWLPFHSWLDISDAWQNGQNEAAGEIIRLPRELRKEPV